MPNKRKPPPPEGFPQVREIPPEVKRGFSPQVPVGLGTGELGNEFTITVDDLMRLLQTIGATSEQTMNAPNLLGYGPSPIDLRRK